MTCYRVTLERANTSTDLVIELDELATTDTLLSILGQYGLETGSVYCDNVPVLPGSSIQSLGIAHGSRLSTRILDGRTDTAPGVKVVVVSGPDAGLSIAVAPGASVVVGRREGDLRIERDELLSRQHVRISWDGAAVTVTDLDSANGTIVEGEVVAPKTAREVAVGEFIHIGSSVLSVVSIEGSDIVKLGAQLGATYAFPRTFREALGELETAIPWPNRAADTLTPEPVSLLRTLLPLVSMAGFFLYRISPWLMFVVAVGPLYMAYDALRRRKRDEARRAQAEAKYASDVEASRDRLAEARVADRKRQRAARPFGGVATVFAATRHRRLWERRAEDPDFLSVTVGLAARPSNVKPVDRGGGVVEAGPDEMWGLPVDVALGATGSIAVLGSIERARGVARSMMLALAVTHSPSDVCLWVFAKQDSFDDWGFARWLPHCMPDEVTSRIASTPQGRSELWAVLRQQLDARIESRSDDQRILPVHVVVIDGADLLPENDVADMLSRGMTLGIIGVIVDRERAPDGVMGTLALGSAADEATFESRHQPRISKVLTAEMANATAESAARRMASLRPSVTGPRALAASSHRLVELFGPAATSPSVMATAWHEHGAATNVVVGSAAETEFRVDLVRSGPHGLIGGATRSGKTEFLKTLIMSLAASNHPDDLNFVIIDFKGGIDYSLARALPHVLEVCSNQDIDGFERTITMLMAEQDRRQKLFKDERVVNLDAYRVALAARPHLPSVPRLVVIVDEFGELSSSEIGKAQLKKLESITRIGAGLGINLVLVTQNFAGQLPDQIAANTGLRVCFRVQESGHSKVLLGSGIAATLDATLIGRGYAQFKGSDPIEFQSARIAGRRPDLVAAEAHGSLYVRPFSTIHSPLPKEDQVDPPDEETDLYALLELITKAAASTGWTASAIPWPGELPNDAPLVGAIDVVPVPQGVIPFGLVDLPEEQRQGSHALRYEDDHILLLGGAQADLQHAIAMVGISAALVASPDDLHLYGIDLAGRGLSRLALLPHCGGVASRNDVLALRILSYLNEEIARRRSLLMANGVTTLAELEQRTGIRFPHVVLLVASAERLLSQASGGGGNSVLLEPLTTLIADAPGLGMQVVLAGTPMIGNYRPGASISRRLVFRTVDTSDAVSLGAPRRLVADLDTERKFVDVQRECSGVVCSIGAGVVPEAQAVEALAYRLRQRYPTDALSSPPRALKEVVWPLTLTVCREQLSTPPEHSSAPVALGLDGLTGDAIWLDALDDGPTFFITGERKSGRSNALMAIGRFAAEAGWQVIGTSLSKASPLAQQNPWFKSVALSAVDNVLGGAGDRVLLLVDDFHRPLQDAAELQHASKATLIIMTGTPTSMDSRGNAKTLGLKPPRNGIALMPRARADFEAMVGLRFESLRPELIAVQRKGVGVVSIDGELSQIVLPIDPDDVRA